MNTVLLYIDPGTGTLVWQVLAASFLGLLFYAKKIKSAVFSWRPRKEKESAKTIR